MSMLSLPKKNTFFIEKWEVNPLHNTISDGSNHREVEPKAMQILEYLACYAGETVHRDALFKTFWPDQNVTEEALTRIISHLRHCFADLPRSPQYIITIRKTGYRLIAKVSSGNYFTNYVAEVASKSNITSFPAARRSSNHNVINTAGKGATFSTAILLIYMMFNQPVISNVSDVKTRYITDELGEEMSPVISADGLNLIYGKAVFGTVAEYNNYTHLYLKNIESQKIVRLNTPQGIPTHPAWSPNMRYVAYANEEHLDESKMKFGIYSTDIESGEVKRLIETTTHNHGISWSPDNNYLVYPDGPDPNNVRFLYRLDLNSGKSLRIAPYNSENTHTIYSYPRYSPDGTYIAVKRTDRGSYDSIDLIDAKTYLPSKIYSTKTRLISFEWKNSDTLLIAEGSVGSSQLLELSIRDGVIRYIDIYDRQIDYLSYSPASKRLVYESLDQPYNIYATNFADDVRALDYTAYTQSSMQELEAVGSSDDQLTAIVSSRDGSFDIWLRNRVDIHAQKLTTLKAFSITGIDWSPNNKRLAFVATIDHKNAVYWVDVDSRMLDSFSYSVSSHYSLVGWDANDSLLFSTHFDDSWKLWRLNTQSKSLELVSDSYISQGRLSPDRKTLYFSKTNESGIWKTEVFHMQAVLIPGTENISTYNSWTVSDKGIYYFMYGDIGEPEELSFLSFNTYESIQVALIWNAHLNRIYWQNNRLYYSLYENRTSNVALLEGL